MMNSGEYIVLCVDDDENVLKSLKRLLRKEPYHLMTASSGKDGLEILKKENIHIVLSDQRMPDMTGTEFLTKVRELYPDIIRIVLTGYTDVDSITESINKGNIYKFFLKPWNDDNLKLEIRQALNHFDLIQSNKKLSKQVLDQNEALKSINDNLEVMVKERTEYLEIQNQALMLSRSVLDHIPLPVIGISAEGTIVLINNITKHLLIDKCVIEIGKSITECFSDSLRQVIDDVFKTEKPHTIENYLISSNCYNLVLKPLDGAFQGKGLIMVVLPYNIHINDEVLNLSREEIPTVLQY